MGEKRAWLTAERRNALLLAVVLVAACHVACALSGGMMYLSNDDASIQATLSGARTGTPYPFVWFVNALVTAPIAALYGILPGVQWWFVWSHLLLAIGMLLASYAVAYAALARAHLRLPLTAALACALDVGLLLYSVQNVSFTLAPAAVGAGIAALLLADESTRGVRPRVALLVLFVLSLAHREESGLVAACYVVLALLASELLREDAPHPLQAVRAVIPSVAVLVVVSAVAIVGNRVVQQQVNGSEYAAFNDARSAFVDYPHASYQEDPQRYADVGWDYNLYALVSSWCFMDERVTTENLVRVSEQEPSRQDAGYYVDLVRELLDSGLARGAALSWLLVTLASLGVVCVSRDARLIAVCALGVLGTCALLGLQVLMGRLLYRSVMVALLPGTTLALVLAVIGMGAAGPRQGAHASRQQPRGVVAVAIALVIVACLVPAAWTSVGFAFDRARLESGHDAAERNAQLCDFAVAHPDLVLIKGSGMPNDRGAQKTFPDRQARPVNLLAWGGSEYGSRLTRRRFELNGLASTTGEVFRDARVRLLWGHALEEYANGGLGGDVFYAFYNWQHDRYGAVGVTQEREVCPGVYAYRMLYGDEQVDTPVYTFVDGEFVQEAEE